MNDACPREPDVLHAATTGAWSQATRDHLMHCADCSAAAETASWMSSFAAVDDQTHPLPDPAVLWLKAKLLQSNAAAQRATLPITRLQIAAYLIVAASWAALLSWKWNALHTWINGLAPTHLILGATGAESTATLSMTVFLVVIILSCGTVGLAMHTILAEE